MYQIHTNRIDGKNRTVNLHDLPIGNTYCHRLTRDDLLREVVALNVPGVEPWMGHMDIALRYGVWCQQCREQAATQ
jgi:hypothetical protein